MPTEDMSFVYNSADQLVQAIRGPPESGTVLGLYDYNHAGLRVRHRFSERGDVDYYYDENAVIEERNAGDGSLLAFYRYADRLISLDTGSEKQYYHHDALGSTVNLTDESGGVRVSYILDPWGHIREQIGESVNRQIFTGKEHDENTGLIYCKKRYYDPDIARFTTQDAYLGELGTPPSLHRYLYSYSNPTAYIDSNGRIVVTAGVLAYLGWRAIESAIETGVEAGIAKMTDDGDFNAGLTFAKNMAVNSVIGLIPGAAEAKIGTKAAICSGKLALRTVGDTAVDVATREGSVAEHLARNTVANIAGDAGAAALRKVGRRLDDRFHLGERAERKIRGFFRRNSESWRGLHDRGERILRVPRKIYSSAHLGMARDRRAHLHRKFRGDTEPDLDAAINRGRGYLRGVKAHDAPYPSEHTVWYHDLHWYLTFGKGEHVGPMIKSLERRGINVRTDMRASSAVGPKEIKLVPWERRAGVWEEFVHTKQFVDVDERDFYNPNIGGWRRREYIELCDEWEAELNRFEGRRTADEIQAKSYIFSHKKMFRGIDWRDKLLLELQLERLRKHGIAEGY